MTPQQLLERLAELGIETETIEHPAVYTVEEAKLHRGGLSGVHTKNLFVRDKKKKMWLITTTEDRPIDLKAVGQRLGAKNLSFGSPERLQQYLGLQPGSVTPLAAINDADKQVKVVLDRALFTGEPICVHPLVNTHTTALSGDELIRFLESTGHPPQILDLGRLV
jgi:Ala-tRNA(Pro) deacylase